MPDLALKDVLEKVADLRDDMNSQWEMTCSMFRSLERVLDVLSRDSISTVDVMKDLSETQRGLVKYITDKKDTNMGGGEGITSICNIIEDDEL